MSYLKRILIIEDDPITIQILSGILESAGYTWDSARDGYDGLEKVKASRPDAIICDVIMPRMDGFAFCRELIQQNPDIPLFMLSSELRLRDVFVGIGAKGFFLKPLNSEDVVAHLKEAIGESTRPIEENKGEDKGSVPLADKEEKLAEKKDVSQPAKKKEGSPQEEEGFFSPPEKMGEGLTILLAEDENDIALVIQQRLKKAGFSVRRVSDGREALAEIEKALPDLIITDVIMPEMDGFSLYKRLQQDERTKTVPVLVMTARGKFEDSFRAVGAEYFLPKPYDPKDLFKILEDIIKRFALKGQSGQKISKEADTSPMLKEEKMPPSAEEAKQEEATPPIKKEASKEETPKKEASKEETLQRKEGLKRVFVYGIDEKTLTDMGKKLEQAQCNVYIENIAQNALQKIKDVDPDLILLQLHLESDPPVDKIISGITSWIRKKVQEAEATVKDKRFMDQVPDVKQPPIIVFKVAEEANVSATTDMNEQLIVMEDLLQKCANEGMTKYIGMYSRLAFLSKIKEYL